MKALQYTQGFFIDILQVANEINIFPFESMALKMNIKLQIYITIKSYNCHINKQQMPKGEVICLLHTETSICAKFIPFY